MSWVLCSLYLHKILSEIGNGNSFEIVNNRDKWWFFVVLYKTELHTLPRRFFTRHHWSGKQYKYINMYAWSCKSYWNVNRNTVTGRIWYVYFFLKIQENQMSHCQHSFQCRKFLERQPYIDPLLWEGTSMDILLIATTNQDYRTFYWLAY